uniref:TIR domain-containing protein n=1 Tax=Candidatus Kentrum sp. UNK TaxID=2126344 RepID=A0A451AQC0_9GAMM|nr:MAG: TIR domain-containing protein [Candidatus Kentron sp. UNK]VFK73507.1 MAG: TIR domain-containing protein [Candidatus Kentron sp. UNK]
MNPESVTWWESLGDFFALIGINNPAEAIIALAAIAGLITASLTIKTYLQNRKKEKDTLPQSSAPPTDQGEKQTPSPTLQARTDNPPPERAESPIRAKRSQRIALLYKRHAEPDETLLRLLEERLTAAGHDIFIDRHLAIGVEWARQIDREIHRADAVIPLLSERSMRSEMLASELEIARQAAREQNGRPRILPVRLRDEAPLPNELDGIIGRLQHTLWRGPEDDAKVTRELLDSLDNPPDPAKKPVKLEMTGGAVTLDSEFYVARPTDQAFQDAVARRDTVILVKGARQMGKTSLLARGIQQAREAGVRVVLTDFQKLTAGELEGLERFYLALGEILADQLELDVRLEDAWRAGGNPNTSFERWLRREILGKSEKPLLWAMDEVDRLFDRDFGSEVFGLFRSWHNARALDPGGPWSRLTLAIAYATEAHLFIEDPNQSPFNVGTRIALDDFTLAETRDLNRRHDAPLGDEAELLGFYDLLGGQPYLTRRGLSVLVEQGLSMGGFAADGFTALATQDDGPFGDHLRRMLMMLSRNPELCDITRGLLRGESCPDSNSFYRLRSAGIIAGDAREAARPRCALYALYLREHLL